MQGSTWKRDSAGIYSELSYILLRPKFRMIDDSIDKKIVVFFFF